MSLRLNPALKLFKAVGITPHVVKTGHPEWVRVFIEFEGCRYGRASFRNHELYNIKWYDKGQDVDNLRTTDRLKVAIALMRDRKLPLSDKLWDLLAERAKLKQEEVYQVKLAKREQLEEQDVARGAKKPKKRSRIVKPNIRNFLTLEGV